MTTRTITISPAETHVGGKFSNFSVTDLGTAADALIAMRNLAHTHSCLSNHMGREELEDFFDALDGDFVAELGEMEKELLFRSPADTAEAADIEDIILKIAFAIRPNTRAWDIRNRTAS